MNKRTVNKRTVNRQTGYRSPAKQKYRDEVWNEFCRFLGSRRLRTASLAILPGLEGLEIPFLQNRGIPLSNITIIDSNPAVVATLKKRYPALKTVGLPVVRAIEERIPRASLQAINLDLCGSLCNHLLRDLSRIAASNAWDRYGDCAIAITVLRGRETKGFLTKQSTIGLTDCSPENWNTQARTPDHSHTISRIWHQMSTSRGYGFFWHSGVSIMDAVRLAAIERALSPTWKSSQVLLRNGGTYNSGKQTMLWSIWALNRQCRRDGLLQNNEPVPTDFVTFADNLRSK